MITHRSYFWIILFLFSTACALCAFKFFSHAFPIVNLNITADRHDVITKAQDLAQAHTWGPHDFQATASFETDSLVKTYIELEAGGAQAFAHMLQEKLYEPYTWKVRHFKPLEINETTIEFTPQGVPYRFEEKISEQIPGAALSATAAQKIAEEIAATEWQIDLSAYTLIESSQKTQVSSRIDHTFTYERIHTAIGKALYRLKLVVSGDKLTTLSHFMFIPENFNLRYTEMRSANNSITVAASICVKLLYIFGGCIGGFIFLMRKRFIVWKQPLLWACALALGNILISINQSSLSWMHYNTALAPVNFYMQSAISTLFISLYILVLYGLIFIAAEGLTRAAFGNHIQLWHTWHTRIASSFQLLGRSLGGYCVALIWLAYVVFFYILSKKYMGWWQPSNELFDPNILATYIPWIAPVYNALSAGFMEECLFRAVPLSCAALLGNRFGKKNIWIFAACIVQAFVFGAGHAFYPAFPAYARVVELIVPSLIAAGIYLLFGLLPTIIAHFIYDLTLMAIPIFASSAHGILLDKFMVIFCGAIPLLVILIARMRSRVWHKTVPPEAYNKNWQPSQEIAKNKDEEHAHEIHAFSKPIQYATLAVGLVAFITWNFFTPIEDNARALTVRRSEAKKNAHEYVLSQGITLEYPWEQQVIVRDGYAFADFWHMQHRFIWQIDKILYKKLMDEKYLRTPYWRVDYVRFAGTPDERSEQFTLVINNFGVLGFGHVLAQSTPGNTLNLDTARALAINEIRTKYALKEDDIIEICAKSSKMPARTDWSFTFNNISLPIPSGGQARIDVTIAGDTVTDSTSYIFVPEQWQRQEQDSVSFLKIVSILCFFLLILFTCLGALYVQQRKASFDVRKHLLLIITVIGIVSVSFFNALHLLFEHLNTTEPWISQLLTGIGTTAISYLAFLAFFISLLAFTFAWRAQYSVQKNIINWLIGFSAGIFVTAVYLVTATFLPSTAPLWADYKSLDSLWPLLTTLCTHVEHYLLYASVLYIMFIGFNTLCHKHVWTHLLIFFIGVGIVGFLKPATTFTGLLILGCAMSVSLWIIYEIIFKKDLSLIFVTVAAYQCLQILQQGMFNAYPGVGAAAIISALGILSLSWHFFKHTGKQ